MPTYTDYLKKANDVVADGLGQAQELNLGALKVLHDTAALLVPITVAALPRGARLVPAIDGVVNRAYDAAVDLVDAQYGFALQAVRRLQPAN